MTLNSEKLKKGFTLAELLVTLAVMGIVLALVVSFSVLISDSTEERTETSAALKEVEDLNELVTNWFYAFDTTEYTVAEIVDGSESPEYIYDYEQDKAVKVVTNSVSIKNKNYLSMMNGGIVPTNYEIIYSVDRATYKPAVTAIHSAGEAYSVTLQYVEDVQFDWDADLGLLKCTYKYRDAEDKNVKDTYTLVLHKHTEG